MIIIIITNNIVTIMVIVIAVIITIVAISLCTPLACFVAPQGAPPKVLVAQLACVPFTNFGAPLTRFVPP
eukprot:9498078-Pyramimonas_sp.AAC.1